MNENIERLTKEALAQVSAVAEIEDLERLRVQYLGKKGSLTLILHKLKDLEPNQRKEVGALINRAKSDLESRLSLKRGELQRRGVEKELQQAAPIDVTLPGQYAIQSGSLHPISHIMEEIIQILGRVGFSLATGPEVETEYYNFEALNTPEEHPARDVQDTFFIKAPVLLRSHTSSVQIRAMKKFSPPLQTISIGRVYRSDYDATHTPMFHQVEGLLVDEGVSFADLKGTLHYLVKEIFGTRKLRFRPSFFPFTEPSAEVDMQWSAPNGKTSWLEIGGCGMVHPNVFKAVKYDPEKVSGFAFGMGLERIAMLKYGISDLRTFFDNDYRMLEQF